MARAPECPARPANAARSRGGELAAIARHAAVVLAGQLAAVAFGLAGATRKTRWPRCLSAWPFT